MLNTNILHANRSHTHNINPSNSLKPRFKWIWNIEYNENDNDTSEEINAYIDWGGATKTLLLIFNIEIWKKNVYCLFIGSTKFGGKVLPNINISGYTEIRKNVNMFRAHPY